MKVVHCLMLMCLTSMLVGCQSLSSSSTPTPTPPQRSPMHNNHHGSGSYCSNDALSIRCEVIGSSGRIGSQFMRLLGSQALAVPRGVCPGSTTTTTSGNASSAFILVCTPSSAWNSIYQHTLPERRCDLVFCGNGLLDDLVDNHHHHHHPFPVTQLIPHYSVATVGGPARVETTAPPTYIYGKYATQLRDCLVRRGGVSNVEILESAAELRVKALQKILWSSCLWLLCHVQRQHPLTVGQVYEEHVEILVALVHELWPKFQSLLTKSNSNHSNHSNGNNITMAETLTYMQDYSLSIPDAIPSWELAMEELKDRNQLLAAPHQPLHRTLLEQVAGSQAVAVVFDDIAIGTDGVDDDMTVNTKTKEEPATDDGITSTRTIDLRDTAGISVYGTVIPASTNAVNVNPQPQPNPSGCKRIVVIGSGLLGTSVAYHLALFQERQQPQTSNSKCKITVVSEQSDVLDATPTTRASWAWINANQKHPLAYQHLNSLGMHAWRSHPLLRQLPTWQGSLVQHSIDDHKSQVRDNGAGHYAYHFPNPLSKDEWRALEPNVELAVTMPTPIHVNGGRIISTEAENHHPERPSTVYSFPNEGSVDPIQALLTLRKAAIDLGVEFVWNQNVARIIESNSGIEDDDDDDNRNTYNNGDTSLRNNGVIGVECVNVDPNDDSENRYTVTELAGTDAGAALSTKQHKTIAADMVVVAAGTGSERLTGLPMMHSPGGIVSIQPSSSPDQSPVTLSKIVVDTVGKSHALQRRNGRIVAGGGALEFGGSSTKKPAAFTSPQHSEDIEAKENALWSSLCALVPKLLSPDKNNVVDTLPKRLPQRASFAFANRPIPQDGLPSVGFVRPGVYTVVTHSGVTLAPLLGPLAAQEILANVVDDGRSAIDLYLLAPYRPTRFSPQEQSNHEENGFFKMLDEKIKVSSLQLSLFAPWARN